LILHVFLINIPDVSLDDTLAAPPCTQSIPLNKKIHAIKDILQLTADTKHPTATVVAFDAKAVYTVLARGLGVVFGQCRDPLIANWLLDPGAREKTLHSMVTNYLPEDLPLLEGL
jgi:DNA polymerase theta